MADVRFQFRCSDVTECDVVISSKYWVSILEAARSHLKDVHGLDLSDDELASYIEER